MFGIFESPESWVAEILLALGYLGIALLVALETVIPPIPSEVILPLAGFQVADGRFAFPLAVAAATAGSLAGALFLYGIGYWFAPARLRRLVDQTGRYVLVDVSDLDRAQCWFDRHAGMAVLVGRVVPGLRSLISLPAGLARMPLWRFAAYTLVGSGLWNAALIGLGWMLKDRWELVGDYVPIVEYGVLAVLVVLVVRFLWRRRGKRLDAVSNRGVTAIRDDPGSLP